MNTFYFTQLYQIFKEMCDFNVKRFSYVIIIYHAAPFPFDRRKTFSLMVHIILENRGEKDKKSQTYNFIYV